MSPPSVSQPVLVYDRIAQNRRKTVILVALAIALTVPFIGAVSFGVSEFLVAQFGPRTDIGRTRENAMRRALSRRRESGRPDTEFTRELDNQLEAETWKMRVQREKDEEAIARFRMQMMTVVAGGFTALLGLLFWTVASSSTSKVLTMCGARPAGASENEARRILENLSIGAGLPTPKLYVINSPTPNAFAAGTDPSHSVVAVTQGLLTLLEYRELEGVLAHELSHIGNHDTRLNTVVAALALFLRLPYLLVKRRIDEHTQNQYHYVPVRRRGWFRLMFTVVMLPAIVYVFVVAPILATLIRSAISRSREFLADADAALLSRNPEGLVRALAKIAGAGSVVAVSNPVIAHLYFADPQAPGIAMGLFRGSLLATHPPIEKRIARLMEFNGGVPGAAIEQAVHEGKEFTRFHPPVAIETLEPIKQDEISVLTAGNPMGRVYRVLSATSLYDRPDVRSFIVARVPAGGLLVVFDDPGRFRQVLTTDQTFGYMPASVKIQKVDMLPGEIHDPAARAAAESAAVAAQSVAQSAAARRLSPAQVLIATALGVTVFAGIFIVMMKFGGN